MIGYNGIGASSTSYNIYCHGAKIPLYFYTAIAGDEVQQFHIYGHNNFAVSFTLNCAVYTVTAGLPDVRVGPITPIQIVTDVAQWWDSAAVNIALTAGVTYTICYAPVAIFRQYRDNIAPGTSRDPALTLQATWNQTTEIGHRLSFYADTANVAPPVIAGIIHPCCAQLIT